MTQVEYQALTKKITDLFPKEVAGTYYVPGVKRCAVSIGRSPYAQGKLVNKVRNIVKRSDEAIPIRKRKSSSSASDQEINNKILIKATAISDQDLEKDENYVWLKLHSDPWTTVEEKWKQTYITRRSNTTNTTSVEQFLQKWPILRDLRSDTLVSSNFIMLLSCS